MPQSYKTISNSANFEKQQNKKVFEF